MFLSVLTALFQQPLPVGTPAPAFSMLDQYGHTQRLGAYRGQKVLLVFFRHYDSAQCRAYLSQLRDHWRELQAQDWVVIAINPLDWEALHQMALALKLPFPVVFDPLSKYAKQYHAAWLRSFLNKRLVYALDEQGRVIWSSRGYRLPDLALSTPESIGLKPVQTCLKIE